MKRIASTIAAVLLAGIFCLAQTKNSAAADAAFRWFDPTETASVHGQGWPELRSTYFRLPDKAHGVVRDAVWTLSRNSAGLSLVFRTDASEIRVRYKVTGGLAMWHMPSTGVSGVDLYVRDGDGGWLWCAPVFTPSIKQEQCSYVYDDITVTSDGAKEFHLYLPLYNTVQKMEVGVPAGSSFEFIPVGDAKPLVFYGTSIAQGACASRPGQAWGNILDRETLMPAVNIAFSGNGKLEPELFSLLCEIDAAMYIIDCMPNMSGIQDDIEPRLIAGVKMLRASHSCPIILVEHCGSAGEKTSAPRKALVDSVNGHLQKAYKALLDEGVPGIWYMSHDEIGLVESDMVEGIHPTDLGMRRYADAYEKLILKILLEESGL